jgi:zinc transport system substrate-binding protein
MRPSGSRLVVWVVVGMIAALAVAAVSADVEPTVVVTTSMLSAAVSELVAPDAPVDIIRLVPPGSCPGHFDLTPRVVPELRRASVIVRHDYQQFLEERLADLGVDGRVVVASTPGSLLIPEHYLQLVAQVQPALKDVLPVSDQRLEDAAGEVAARVQRSARRATAAPQPWSGRPVVASAMQAELCRWLGMNVVAELPRGEDLPPRRLGELMALEPDAVIANLQEGTRAAEVLAERLGCPLVVLSSFPDVDGYGSGWDELFAANLERLAAAWD